MRNYLLTFGACILTIVLLIFFYFSQQKTFSCESQYDVIQYINDNTLHSQGMFTAVFTEKGLLINFEGLLTNNNGKYIVSRSADLSLKKYANRSNVFYITDMAITRHAHDNTPDNIAQQSLFVHQNNDKFIYINQINDDIILFGNPITSQFGCKRK